MEKMVISSSSRILVTGASGFVGSAVVRQLVNAGQNVAVLLRPTSNRGRIADILGHLTVIEGDFCDLVAVAPQIVTFAPDIVIHIAWGGVNGANRNDPKQYDNVTASLALYHLVVAAGCKRFVGLGSQAEYGACPARVYEGTPTLPATLYGAAKLATYFLLRGLAIRDGLGFVWLRLFSSYGPRENPNTLIPYLVRSLLKGERPALTKCDQIWDFIYIDDVAAAVLAAAGTAASGVFNLGSGYAQPLRDVVTSLRDYIDPALPVGFGAIPYRPDQVMHLEANITALTTATGWKPAMPLDEGLRRTVDWFRDAASNVNPG